MACKPVTDTRSTWERLSFHHRQIADSLSTTVGPAAHARIDQLAAIQSNMLTLPAPHLQAVIDKLTWLFDCSMDGDDEDSMARRLVITDLHTICFDLANLAGPQHPARPL